MGYPTPIEWTDATWNPIGGCSIASPGCKPCYAMGLAGTRLKNHPLYKGTTDSVSGRPVFNGTMTAAPDYADIWTWPRRWLGAKHPKLGAGNPRLSTRAPSLIFVGDMADLFHENRSPDIIDRTVRAVAYSHHLGQLLTKRPEVMLDNMRTWRKSGSWRPSKLWLGTSAERQKELDERIRALLELADMGFIVFISYEPALGPLTLPREFLALGRRAWVIAGGVSGRWPRAPHPDWFRSVRDQCTATGVPFFFKQWGEWAPSPHRVSEMRGAIGGSIAAWPDGTVGNGRAADHGGNAVSMTSEGKKATGRLLDGREWNEFPLAA